MWENNSNVLRFAENPFYRHEQAVLAEGECPGFLPMSFIREGRGVIVRYETGGLQPISSYRIERTEDVLFLMERVIMVIHMAPEYLLSPQRIILRTDTAFYSRDRDDLRLAFLPRSQTAPGALPSAGVQPSPPSPAPGVQPASGCPSPAAVSYPTAGAKSTSIPSSGYLLQRELLLFLAQLKQDVHDGHEDFIFRLARSLCYNCRNTTDMLRVTGLLRRELDSLSADGS